VKLNRIAALATIIVAVIVVIQYFSSKNSPVEIPSLLKEQANQITLDTTKHIYKKELSWLLTKYKAAKIIPYYESKSVALQNVVEQALSVNDYNIAILAANDIPYTGKKRDVLFSIVKLAINDSTNFVYALIAAKRIPYSSTKRDALNMIVNANKE